jgi:hypothetical protein
LSDGAGMWTTWTASGDGVGVKVGVGGTVGVRVGGAVRVAEGAIVGVGVTAGVGAAQAARAVSRNRLVKYKVAFWSMQGLEGGDSLVFVVENLKVGIHIHELERFQDPVLRF